MTAATMAKEKYKKLSPRWKLAYWVIVAVGIGFIGSVWIFGAWWR